ncbi:MAG TPA: hypothetical protein PK402_09210 [Tepidisphaeraceae bacterium]|nr:hypothetical protein [Tepidisphaeraceae bacterium]
MSDQPQINHGKQLSFCDTVDGEYTHVAKTQDWNLPDSELGASEFTNDDSPNFTKQYQPGMYEPGTVEGTYVYTDDAFEIMQELFERGKDEANRAADAETPVTVFWKAELPSGAVASWQGFVTKNGLPMDGQDETTVSEFAIQVSGTMTYTAASDS